MLYFNIIILVILNFFYVFRSLAVILRVEYIMYFLTFIVIGLNMFYIFGNLKKQKINLVNIYILFGVVILLYSMILNPPVVGIIGFVVLFLNLLLWDSVIKNINKNNLDSIFKKFIQINVYFACITSLLGVYQYFVDPTIFGLALHDVYGNVELIESGLVVRRVTSLMGSPQNYSLYLAIITTLVSYLKLTKKKKILLYFILLIGGLVSGSRAYSVFIITVILVSFFISSTKSDNYYKNIFKKILLFVLSLGIVLGIFNINFSNTTVERMFKFISDWPALEIYKFHLETLSTTDFLLGKGVGVNERIVIELLGTNYYDIIGEYVNSYESYLLSVFMQLGIIGLLIVLSLYTNSMIKAYRSLGNLYLSILVAIIINLMLTPSFNGLAMSFLIWPLILYPIYNKKFLLKGVNR